MDDKTNERILKKINTLISQEQMTIRDGDNYVKRKRPKNGFTACEIYNDLKLGISERDTFIILNSMVMLHGRLKIKDLTYFLVR